MTRRWMAAGTAAIAVVLLATSTAVASPWPQSGGNAARSGTQPESGGGLPAQLAWARTDDLDRTGRTSIIVTEGATADDQRAVYGTAEGRLIFRRLSNGVRIGGAVDLSVNSAAFGSGPEFATPVNASSTAAQSGQVYAVHNETYADSSVGIEIAHIVAATGERARDDAQLGGALVGWVIDSAPLLVPGPSGADRYLFFVAHQSSGSEERLFRVTITNAGSAPASIGGLVSTPDINANTSASPALVYLNDAAGAPTPYVTVSTISGLATYAVSGLAAGPASAALGTALATPVVPLANGRVPGTAGSEVATAPVVYAASAAGATTTVYAFSQSGSSQTLTSRPSVTLTGTAGPALAADSNLVWVTTSANLYALRASNLTVSARYRSADDAAAGSTGFRFTAPSVTGNLLAVTTDGGKQLLLDSVSLSRFDPALFSESDDNAGARIGRGQPAFASRYVVYASDVGAFAYALAAPPTGYWQTGDDGGVFAFGTARFFGSTGDIALNRPIVDMRPTTTHLGYWLTATDGGVFAFGDAGFFGSTGDIALNRPIVGMAATPSGRGYWLVASDGGVFAFGDAGYFGSTGDMTLNRPIVGVGVPPAGGGYWLVASDGGIFTFGRLGFFGSTGDIALNQPIVGMAASSTGDGYVLVASDGGIFNYGDAGFFGAAAAFNPNRPIVAVAVTP